MANTDYDPDMEMSPAALAQIGLAKSSLSDVTIPSASGSPLSDVRVPSVAVGTPIRGQMMGIPSAVRTIDLDNPQSDTVETDATGATTTPGFIAAPSTAGAKAVSRSADGSMIKFDNGTWLNLRDGSQTYPGPNGTTWWAREGQVPKDITPKYREDTDASGRKFRTNLATGKMEDITPPGFQVQPKLTPLQQVVQQIQSRGFNTNPAVKNWQAAYTKYNQVAANASILKRTIADDTALINAVSGIETPGQALSNEQITLAQKDMSPQEWLEIQGNRLGGNPRMLSDLRVKAMYTAAKRAAEEARGAAAEAIKPFIARLGDAAKQSNAPVEHGINELVGIDPRKPLQEAEPFSGQWKTTAPSGSGANLTPSEGDIYPTKDGHHAQLINGQWKLLP